MRQQAEYALALPLREARLQQPDFLHRLGETPRQGDALGLVQGDAVGRPLLGGQWIDACLLQDGQLAAVGGPQQCRKQEGRRHRFFFSHAAIRTAQCLQQRGAQGAAAVGCKRLRGFRKQRRQQTMALECEETLFGVPGHEHLQALIEQSRRRGAGKQFRQSRQRLRGGRVDGKIKLRSQANRAQHSHRIFAIARLRIAYQLQHARLHVLEPADIIAD